MEANLDLIEVLKHTIRESKVQPAVVMLNAEFVGKNRGPFKKGGRYAIAVHRCAGSRYLNGRWVKDDRVQIYQMDSGNSGFKMYDSIEEIREDFRHFAL